jgi:hypothetical protein
MAAPLNVGRGQQHPNVTYVSFYYLPSSLLPVFPLYPTASLFHVTAPHSKLHHALPGRGRDRISSPLQTCLAVLHHLTTTLPSLFTRTTQIQTRAITMAWPFAWSGKLDPQQWPQPFDNRRHTHTYITQRSVPGAPVVLLTFYDPP